MPELPEVETVVRDLRAARVTGRLIRAAVVHWHRTVSGMSPARFAALVRGRRIAAIGRRAKYIVLTLDRGLTILVHLRMTGQLRIERCGAPAGPHDRLVLKLDDGRALHFRDTRKFGRWQLLENPEIVLDRLGPEPLDPAFTAAAFARRLTGARRRLKPLLLDQSFVAGVGNIYADEALWLARLHPLRRSDTLGGAEAVRLFRAMREVLRRGIAARGTSLGTGRSNFRGLREQHGRNQERVRVFRRTGAPCPRCSTPIARLIVGQRSTHICPRCQAAPRASAGGGR